MVKQVNENWGIINQNGHSTFHTGKHGNFNSLREVIWIILWHYVALKLIDDESQCQKSVVIINILQMMCMRHVLEAPGPYQKILLCKLEWITAAKFYNYRNEKLPSQGSASNAIYRNIILYMFMKYNKVLSKFYYLLIFSPYFN